MSDGNLIHVFSDGQELSQEHHVLSAVITRGFNRLPAAELVLADGDPAAQDFPLSGADTFSPGKIVEIRAGTDTLFKGPVVRHRIRARGRSFTLTVESRHAAVKTALQRNSSVHYDVTDADAIKAVLAGAGVPVDCASTTQQHVQLVQADSTDWDFAVERAEANGLLLRVDDDRIAVAAPDASPAAAATLLFGDSLIELEAETDARTVPDGTSAQAWDPADQAIKSTDAEAPVFRQPGSQKPADLARALGAPPLVLRHPGALPEEERQDWANARALRAALSVVRGRGSCRGNAALKPGATVELKGAGKRFSGKLLLTAVRHQVNSDGWITDFQFGMDARPFAERESDGIVAPHAGGLVPPVQGLHAGVVTALTGDPGSEERIRVRLVSVDAQGPGVWARLSALDAGNSRGAVFRPDVDDEVVVGFLGSDPREPVVLGKLHSSKNASPIAASEQNDQKGFVTRSGMKLVFDDQQKSVELSTPGGYALEIDESKSALTLRDGSGNKLSFSSKGVTLESAGSLELKAHSDATLQGGANVNVKASAQMKAQGASGVEVSSPAQAVLKGGVVQIN